MWELSQIYPRRVKLHWVHPGHTLNSGCVLGGHNLHFQFTAMTRFQTGQFVTSCASAQRQYRRTASNTPPSAAYLKNRRGLAMQDYIPIHVGLSLCLLTTSYVVCVWSSIFVHAMVLTITSMSIFIERIPSVTGAGVSWHCVGTMLMTHTDSLSTFINICGLATYIYIIILIMVIAQP